MLRRTLLCSLLLALSACQQDTGSGPVAVSSNGQKQLLFFMDPQGGPCKLQLQILQGMAGALATQVTLRPVSSRAEADRPLFSSYGIRALPSLVLADAQGQELRRLSPGVQSAETVTAFLNQNAAP